jgi:hypothetical protein
VIGEMLRISMSTIFSPFLSEARSTMMRANSKGSRGTASLTSELSRQSCPYFTMSRMACQRALIRVKEGAKRPGHARIHSTTGAQFAAKQSDMRHAPRL